MDIISSQNTRVKQWAQLLDKKHRDQQQRYLVEGIHLVQEALQSSADIECIAYDMNRGIPTELASAARGDLAVEWIGVSEAVIGKCTEAKTPQPVFAVIRKPDTYGSLFSMLLEQPEGLVVVLDGVQDPGNVGTIIRSADAAGAAGIIVGPGCADIYNPKTVRSTMGSLFHLPIIEGELRELLPQARARGIKLAGTSLQAAKSCYEYDFNEPTWLLFGSEASGLSREVQDMLDQALIIPMKGHAESLNVAMAASVLLFEAMRQRGV